MNILHVIPAFHPAHIYGGPIQSTYELCTHLPLDFCKVRVLTTDADGAKTLLEVETEKEIRLAVGVRLRYCKRVMRHSVSPLILRLLPRRSEERRVGKGCRARWSGGDCTMWVGSCC